jgi:hypothetical protein
LIAWFSSPSNDANLASFRLAQEAAEKFFSLAQAFRVCVRTESGSDRIIELG